MSAMASLIITFRLPRSEPRASFEFLSSLDAAGESVLDKPPVEVEWPHGKKACPL